MLLVERKNNIVELTLNRPETRNALNEDLIAKFTQTLKDLSKDETIEALVLKASGKIFCAGADINWMQKMVNFSEEENYHDALKLAELFSTLYHFPAPTIAVIQGSAFGGGVGLLACCDIAIASEAAKFCFSEAKLGLIPGTISPYIYRRMGAQVATRFFLTAEIFSVDIALKYHLVDEMTQETELEDKTNQVLKNIGSNGIKSLRAIKQLRNKIQPLMSQDAFHFTAKEIARLRISKEAQERMKSFLNKAN